VGLALQKEEFWRRRLYVPNYRIGDAARYARISPQTVAAWHRTGVRPTLSQKEKGDALSYLQLIEVAVVAAFRKSGVPLKAIRDAREYLCSKLKSEFPFAEYKFKTDGKTLFLDYEQIEGDRGRGTLIRPDRQGQLAWESVIGRLQEFEYDQEGIAIRWHVSGKDSPIVIDPRVAFGAPTVSGMPTAALKGRWSAGESITDIADDFQISEYDVIAALKFEGLTEKDFG